MQKQKLDVPYFLAIQATYEGLDLAICQGDTALHVVFISKFDASRQAITTLATLLDSQGLTISNVTFIAVNQGPGPFTTLRTVLATVNGIAYASGIPLVGVDGITTLATAQHTATNTVVVALLNAFNQDVYYAIAQQNTIFETGCKNSTALIQQLGAQLSQAQIAFVGNGIQLCQAEINVVFGTRALVTMPNAPTTSIEQIARQGLNQWKDQQNVAEQLMPIYLKQHAAELRQ